MGDAYRGLTIRIGADNRQLDKALSSIRTSANQAQGQLKLIQNALKLDGTNAQALARQFGLAGDKLALSTKSALALETAIKQTSQKTKSLAASTADIYSSVHRAKESYNDVDKKLNVIDNDMARIAAKQDKINFKTAQKNVRQLRKDMGGMGPAADEARQKIVALLTAASKTGTAEAFGHMKGDAEKLIATYDTLRAQHKKFGAELSSLEKAEGFIAAQNKIIAVRTELKEAAMQAARFRAEFHAVGGGEFSEAISKAKSLDSVLEEMTADTRAMVEASKSMPSNYHAAIAKARSLAAETETLKQKEKALGDALKRIEKSDGFDKLKAQTQSMVVPLEKAKNAYASINTEVKEASAKLEKMKQVQDRLEQGGKQESVYYKNVQNAINKCNAELKELRQREKAADDALKEAAMYREWQKLDSELVQVQHHLSALKAKTSAINALTTAFGRLRTMGYGLYSTVTPALMMVGRYAIQSAEEIDAAYRDMRKTVNGSEEEFEHLRDAAIEFSRTSIVSADQILEIEAMGGQLGIAVGDLEAFATTVSNLDIATNMDSDQISEQLGKMASVIGISVDEYDNFGDALVRLGNNMPVMESDIMTITTRFMGMGKVVGMEADQMLGWAAAASATGQKAEAAGSAMLRFISKMETAVVSGNKQLSEYARVAGMTAEDFADMFGEDASAAMYKFIEGLGDMQKNGESVNEELTTLGINNVRDKQLLEGLANQMANASEDTEILGDALRMASDAYKGLPTDLGSRGIEYAGDAAREADKKMQGFSGSLGKMVNNAKALAMELGEAAAPIVMDLSEKFKSLGDWIKGLSPDFKTLIVEVGGVVAALGPASIAIGAVGNAIGQLFTFAAEHISVAPFRNIANGITKLSGGEKIITGISAALGSLTWGKLALGAAAFFAVGEAIKFAWDKYQTWDTAQNKFLSMASGSVPKVYDLGKSYQALGDGLHYAKINYDDVLKSHANLAKEIEGRNKTAQAEIDRLEAANDVIKKYAGQTNLSASELGKLRSAIETVNEMCGTHLQLVEGTAGAIRDENGAMVDASKITDEYIRAKQKQIETEAILADYNDVLQDRAENIKALAAKTDELAEAEERANSLPMNDEQWEAAQNDIARLNGEIDGLNKMIDDGTTTLENYSYRLGEMTSGAKYLSEIWSSVFEGTFDDGGSSFKAFSEEVKNLGVDIDALNGLSFNTVKQIVDDWKNGGLSEALANAGVETRTFTQQYMDAFDAAGKSFFDFADKFGWHVDDLAAALHDAGYDAEWMSSLSQEALDNLANTASEDLPALIALLDEASGKNFTISPDYDSEGADEAQQDMQDLEDSAATVNIDADAEEFDEAIDDAESRLDSYDGSTYTATADLNTDPANSALTSLLNRLENYDNLHITADADIGGGNAAGGTYSNLIRAIPRHARGAALNGIVTRATMTNVGWVGEAGDEALFHMRNAGGAIIPLSNRQHVRPFARAVAAEMGSYNSSHNSTVINNYSIDGMTVPADSALARAMGKVFEEARGELTMMGVTA